MERTLSIIKPDATARNITGKVNAMIEEAGLRIVAQKRIRLSPQFAEEFYAEHKGKAFFSGLVEFMTSGPVVVQVLDENDNKPQFPEKVYQIKLPERDRKKRGEPIYRAFAFDRDEGPNAEISYSIVDGNDDGRFFIDPKTGMVSSRKQFTAGSYDILTVRFS